MAGLIATGAWVAGKSHRCCAAVAKKIKKFGGVNGGACRVEGIDSWPERPNAAKCGHDRPTRLDALAKCGQNRPAEMSLFPGNRPNSHFGASTIAEKRPNAATTGHGDGCL